MGAESKKAPPLPAPTETDTTTPTELATDISKPGDENSSYSLPEDGTPITIRTRGHQSNRSQTSLLIEYFEGGKVSSSKPGAERRPSVRVRLTPSKKGKGDHFQVTETKSSRKVSLTRRIPAEESTSRDLEVPEGEDAHSMTSYASATEESNVSRNPIDIEIERTHRRRRPASPLIPSEERVTYQPGNLSEISAIPTDSFLDGTGPAGDVKQTSSESRLDSLATAGAAALAGAATADALISSKTRKSGKDRVKLTEKSLDKSDKGRRSKSRTSSISEQVAEDGRSPRRRTSRTHQESTLSGAESSLLSSNLTGSHRSVDARSSRSGASKSSINNPKLLETVEDAIRRLILPELSALKREQSKREGRRSSLTSTTTSASRDEIYSDRKRSSANKENIEAPHKERRNREARHDYENHSLRSLSHDSLEADYRTSERNVASPKRGAGLAKAAAAGAAGILAAQGLSSALNDRSESTDRKHRERRRPRAEATRSRSLGREKYDEEYEEADEPAPPMPLMSDINPSEVTRTSILSAATDRSHSATEESITARNIQPGVTSGASTPIRSRNSLEKPPIMANLHANVSHGDLTDLPRGKRDLVEEYETDDFGRKVPMGQDEFYSRDMPPDTQDFVDYPEDTYNNSYYSVQDVPPPLKYVPYQAGARGLSPIPSVSGYTEGGSEAPLPGQSRSLHSAGDMYSSPGKSPERRLQHSHSAQSFESLQHSPDLRRHNTFMDEDLEQETAPGQEVRRLATSPNIVHPPFGVESAVASLVDGSMVEQSTMTGASGYDQQQGDAGDSTLSAEDQYYAEKGTTSPEKMSLDSRREVDEERMTPGSRSLAHSQEYSEYELDENGRKVPRAKYRHSPTASEAAITAGAVGAAAAALKAAQERKQAAAQVQNDEDYQPAGVARNKSFKERAMGWKPRNTPSHSVDRLDDSEDVHMTATGIPDANNPMPEIGYMDDDLETNPSLIQERLDGGERNMYWQAGSGRATPTQKMVGGYSADVTPRKGETLDEGLGITEAAGAALLGAAAGMATTAQQRESSQDRDEWRRTSDERKRDTLLTNPYEDASPVANPAFHDNLLNVRGLNSPYDGSPGFGHKYDEGYMSNGGNATPDPISRGKALHLAGPSGALDDDPFYVSQGNPRHLSGMSQGMTSPFYDAATGAGIDRIENKDIVALMQHLMVRDAQRSARDTEIVALLMNAALEMRNSFREMKELVQDTGDDVIFASVENTEKLQKAINGPRPYPGTASRSLQSGSQLGTLEDAAKKKNIWKRALQGLSTKGTNDLSRIEDMLVHLLGEVTDLKGQTVPAVSTGGPGRSLDNLEPEGHIEQDKGYEPEGASTASHASQPGNLMVPKGDLSRSNNERKFSDHRISTVPENDEEYQYEAFDKARGPNDPDLLSPAYPEQNQRGTSVPLDTPQHPSSSQQPTTLSAENTPRSDKGKKHKSSSSSGWLPKISRWSETTASSVGRAFRVSSNSKKGKYDDYQPPSRSGSSLASYDDTYQQHDPYGDDKLHTGFSDQQLASATMTEEQPIGVGEAFLTSEDPKYKAHRNSVNLQHPQPRPGQTERFRTALEYSAQEYDSPVTPRSTDWAGSATSLSRLPGNTNRYSNTSSAVARDAEYAIASGNQQAAPPRPPKEPMDSTSNQTPQKVATRVSQLQKDSPKGQMSYESGYGSGSGTYVSHYTERSPKFENRNLVATRNAPSRRPSGPRAMTPKSPEEEAAREERRRKRDTFGTLGSQDTDTF